MTHRDKSLWPHIVNVDFETRSSVPLRHDWSDPATTAAELGTAMHMEIERQRAMWGTPDEVIEEPLITGHYHIGEPRGRAPGDSHIGMGRDEINRQLLAYAHLTDLPAMIVSGGDILHERGIPGPDVIMVVDGDTYHLDYKTCEERIVQFMHGPMGEARGFDLVLPRDCYPEQALQYLNKAIDNVAEPKVVKPKAGRSKDWEQRNRKRRR